MPFTNAQLATALAEACRSVADLGDSLTPAQWSLPTGCPGWTVFDQIAHISSLETVMSGDAEPVWTAPPVGHVRNSIGARMEDLIDRRRHWPPAAVLAELRAALTRRAEQLAQIGEAPDALLPGPTGKPLPASVGLQMRVFDVVAHEQDVRRAVARPGGLDGLAGAVVAEQIPALLARSWSDPVALVIDGRESIVGQGDPVVTLACSLAGLVSAAAGRTDGGPVTVVGGDPDLGARLIAGLGVTP